jgi:hypothetical protein
MTETKSMSLSWLAGHGRERPGSGRQGPTKPQCRESLLKLLAVCRPAPQLAYVVGQVGQTWGTQVGSGGIVGQADRLPGATRSIRRRITGAQLKVISPPSCCVALKGYRTDMLVAMLVEETKDPDA